MEYIKYLVLGLIQGISEILPISSSSHLMLFSHLFKIESTSYSLELFLNTASFLAIALLFYQEIWFLIKTFFTFIFKKEKREKLRQDFYYILKLLIAVIPIGIVGLLIKDYLDGFKTLLFIGVGLFITGSLLILTYFINGYQEDDKEISFLHASFIGVAQVFSVFPGISRSGSTIIAGRFAKKPLQKIITFSFLTYIIISVPTSALGIYQVIKEKESINLLGFFLGFIISFIATFLTGKFILKKLKIKHLVYFGFYCVLISIITVILHFT